MCAGRRRFFAHGHRGPSPGRKGQTIMATNYVQEGKILDFTAPYDRTSGQGFQVGSIFAVALGTALSGAAIRGQIAGVWTLAKTSAQAWTVGQKIYWDNTNKRCDTDSTVGMLIGVAQAVAANPSSTGNVRLNGSSPATAEGPQAAEADLTDNGGGAAADGTIGAVTAPTAIGATLTDSTGDSGTHDDTLADGLTTTAFVADNGGATADGTVEAMTGLGAALDLSNLDDGSADNILVAIDDTSTGNRSAQIEVNFDKLGDEVNTLITLTGALANNVQECVDKVQTITTDLATQNQNDSDLAQKVIELVTAQGQDRTAIVALTDAVKELSTKQNALLAKLRIAGILAT